MAKKAEKKATESLSIIGSTTYIDIADEFKHVPAKIDTGADSSSIWATGVNITEDGALEFILFGKTSPFYTGKKYHTKDYKVAVVRSATGEEQIRYRTHLSITLGGHKIRALFYLSNRSRNNFPVLIGKRTLRGKFLVDSSKTAIKYPKNPKNLKLSQKLRKNPFAFHQKYVKKGKE